MLTHISMQLIQERSRGTRQSATAPRMHATPHGPQRGHSRAQITAAECSRAQHSTAQPSAAQRSRGATCLAIVAAQHGALLVVRLVAEAVELGALLRPWAVGHRWGRTGEAVGGLLTVDCWFKDWADRRAQADGRPQPLRPNELQKCQLGALRPAPAGEPLQEPAEHGGACTPPLASGGAACAACTPLAQELENWKPSSRHH